MKSITKAFFALALLMATGAGAYAEQSIFPDAVTGEKGATVELAVNMTNGTYPITAFQCDIALPEGVAVGKPTFTERADDHSIAMSTPEANVYRYVVTSMSQSQFDGESGAVFTLPLTLDAEAGTYTIILNNVVATDEDGTVYKWPGGTSTLTITAPSEKPDNFFYCSKLNIQEGKTSASVDIFLTNSKAVKEFEFSLALPDGVTIKKTNGIASVTERFDEGDDEDAYPEYSGNVVTGVPFTPVTVGDGKVMTITLRVASPATPGAYDVEITDQIVTLADNTVEVNLVHGTPYDIDSDLNGVDVRYIRDFSHTGWQAFYVPFDIPVAELEGKAEVATLEAIGGTDETPELIWKKVTEGFIPASTPCIIKPANEGQTIFTAKDTSLSASAEESVSKAGNGDTFSLTGIYHVKSDMATSGAYALAKGVFRPTNSNSHLLYPYLVYLTIQSSRNKMPAYVTSVVDGQTTSVELNIADPDSASDVYDIIGRNVGRGHHGIIIENGKKIMNK